MGLSQANISNILHGHLRGFSSERLFRCLNALGQDVEITIRPKPAARNQGRVSAATAATPA